MPAGEHRVNPIWCCTSARIIEQGTKHCCRKAVSKVKGVEKAYFMKCPDINGTKIGLKYTFVCEYSRNHKTTAMLWLWPSSKRTCYVGATCLMHFLYEYNKIRMWFDQMHWCNHCIHLCESVKCEARCIKALYFLQLPE